MVGVLLTKKVHIEEKDDNTQDEEVEDKQCY